MRAAEPLTAGREADARLLSSGPGALRPAAAQERRHRAALAPCYLIRRGNSEGMRDRCRPPHLTTSPAGLPSPSRAGGRCASSAWLRWRSPFLACDPGPPGRPPPTARVSVAVPARWSARRISPRARPTPAAPARRRRPAASRAVRAPRTVEASCRARTARGAGEVSQSAEPAAARPGRPVRARGRATAAAMPTRLRVGAGAATRA